jgi:hypothetical protein
MNTKAIVFIVVVVAIGLAIFLMPKPDENRPAPVQSSPMSEAGEQHSHNHAPLSEIDSLLVTVQDSTSTELATLALIPHKTIELPGTRYSLHLTDFYTHFMMEDAGPVNASPYPENPAARIEIFDDGILVDYTWTFEKVPFFRMGGMEGPHGRVSTGLAFSVLEVYGLVVPSDTPNP